MYSEETIGAMIQTTVISLVTNCARITLHMAGVSSRQYNKESSPVLALNFYLHSLALQSVTFD